jgi:hypothetical protein
MNPFDDRNLLLSHWTLLVESESPAGAGLVALPEQTLCLPGEFTRRGMLVLGLPGSGKTRRFLERCVAAALCHPDTSVVVFAVQPGSARQAIAASRSLRGESALVSCFNPGKATGCSQFLNPLHGVQTKSEAKDIARLLSQTLKTESRSGDDTYFKEHAIRIIAAGILALQKVTRGNANLGDLKDALDGGGGTLQPLAEKGESPILADFARDLLSGHSNTMTTLTYAANILSPWDDDQSRIATSAQELDFEDLLATNPGLLVISVDEDKIQKLAGLTSLVFHCLFTWIIRAAQANGGALPRHLFIFVDELPAAGCLPDLGTRLTATFRKSNVSFIAAAQCEAQLHAVYQNDAPSVIAGFGSRIFVPPVDSTDAEGISARSGIIETSMPVTTASGQIISHHPQTRPLLLPSEINAPNHKDLGPRMTFALAGLPPFQAYLRGSWEIPEESAILRAAKSLELPVRVLPKSETDQHPDWLHAGFTDTRGWSDKKIRARLAAVCKKLSPQSASDAARRWWSTFEKANQQRPALLLRLAEELLQRKATIEEFFRAYLISETNNIQANLHFLDYLRLKEDPS